MHVLISNIQPGQLVLAQVERPHIVVVHSNQTAAAVRVAAEEHAVGGPAESRVLAGQLLHTVHIESAIARVAAHRHLIAAAEVRLAA